MEETYRALTREAKEYEVGQWKLKHEHFLFWDKENHKAMDLGFIDDINLENMVSVAEKSGYGDMETLTTKYDDSVRKALEIHIDKVQNVFGFQDGLISLFHPDSVKIKPYKFTIYEEGGFFSKHTDSCNGPDMLGTIVMMMNPAEEGGEFYVKDKCIPLDKKGSWVFLYGDLEHEVKPVTKGTRVALTFKVFAKEAERLKKMARKTYDDKIEDLIKMIKDSGERIAFITNHNYGAGHHNVSFDMLKGVDKEFYEALNSHGFVLKLSKAHVWSDSKPIDYGDFEVDYENIELDGYDYNDYPEKIILPDRIISSWYEGDTDYSGHSGNEASHESVRYDSMAIVVEQ